MTSYQSKFKFTKILKSKRDKREEDEDQKMGRDNCAGGRERREEGMRDEREFIFIFLILKIPNYNY